MTTTEPRLDLEDDQYPADLGELEWKALPKEETTSPLTGVIGHDDAEGTITAIVAVSGVPDKVGDVIVPGSLGTAVKRLKPKGVTDHNWGQKVSKLVYSEELMPGDPRLPKKTPDGAPWPAAAGGLLIKAQYNMDKQAGRDAYSDAKFYGPEECFSIGYKVRPGGAKMRRGLRYLHDYDIYEWSQVLHGAHPLATLTGVKSLSDGVTWYAEQRSGQPDEGILDVKALPGRRVVRDSQFWGLPVGTPIKLGMKPRGQGRAASPREFLATTSRADETADKGPVTVRPNGHPNANGYALPDTPPELPGATGAPTGVGQTATLGAPAPGEPTPVPAAVRPGVAAALAALHQRYQDFATAQHDQSNQHAGAVAATSMNMLSQFAAPGADVHASPDGQFAAVNNGKAWVIVDTANAGTLPPASPDIPAAQIDDALQKLTELGIPWGNVAARKKRWANAKTKAKDQQAVQEILTSLTPFDAGHADTSQARYDAEGAIQEGNTDDLADALTRMGLPDDQDPHDVAQALLVLPSDVVQRRLDAIAAQGATHSAADAAAGLPANERDRAAHEAAQRAAGGAFDDHSAPEPETAEPQADEFGIIEGPDGELDLTPEAAGRQDRVEKLLDADPAALKSKTDEQLGSDRQDLVTELALQTELSRRDQSKPAKAKAHEADAPAPGVGGTPEAGTPEQPKTPKTRPGLAGAAEDLGDLLNATPRDDDAIAAAATRFDKLLAKHPADSPAFAAIRTAITGPDNDGDLHAAIAAGRIKPGMLFAAAQALRDQRKATRNEQARARRAAKRIERDRIRSAIGAIDTELRARGRNPEDYGGHVEGVATVTPGAGADTSEGTAKPPPGSSASTPAPSKPSPDTGPFGDVSQRHADAARQRIASGYPHPGDEKIVAAYEKENPATPPRGEARDADNGDVADALAARQAVRRNVPDVEGDTRQGKAQNHMRAARAAADEGDFDTAHGHLDKAQQLNPERSPLWAKARGIIREQQDRAQAGEADDREQSTGRASGAVVPAVPTEGVRGNRGQGDVLRDTRGTSGAGDRPGGGEPGRTGPARGDVRGEAGPDDQRAAGGDRTGDAQDTAGRRAPELAGQRLPAAGDTGPEPAPGTAGQQRRGADRGDERVRGGERGTGSAESGRAEGADADTAETAGLPERRDEQSGQPEQPDAGVDQPVTEAQRDAATAADGEPVAENTPELPDEQPTSDRGQVDAIPTEGGQDFRPVNGDDLAPAGKRAKLDANIAALEVLRELQRQHRPATEEEQHTLARWAGWGGLPEVFDDDKPEYAADRAKLRGLLDDKEWAEARRNTLNAHYTDAAAITAIWQAVQDLGFDGGRVLEPGSGSGNFIGLRPGHLDIDMIGVELDSTTAAISRALYPSATIRNESFADTRLPTGSMDAVVGNVPFGDFKLVDRIHNPGRKHSIHNHFILKSLAATKPGGVCALLTSRYTLDSKNSAARKQMAEMGDLIGAVRLPTGSHSKTAGTSVIEDVLIFRRREPDAEPLTSQDWINAPVTDINGHDIPVNQYFLDHPAYVLGDLTAEKGRYGTGDLIVKGDTDLSESLPKALRDITDAAETAGIAATPRLESPSAIAESSDLHDGHIAEDADGNFTQVVGGAAVPFPVPATQAEELRQLIGLRDTLRELLAAEAANVSDTAQIRQLRRDLNDRYDAYVKRYKPINRYTLSKTGAQNRPAQGGFRRDPMSAIVRALEVYDPETGTGTKTNIFTKRAVAPREIPTTADNPADALALSLDTYGEVNLKAIAAMLGTDEADARQRLGTLVFEQPPLSAAEEDAAFRAHIEDASGLAGLTGRYGEHVGIELPTGGTPLDTVGESVRAAGSLEPAAAYLSGNVRRKLAAATEAAKHDARFQANVDALRDVIPADLGIDEVDGRLGAAWIPAEDVRQFMVDLLHGGDDQYGSVKVATSGGGIWEVTGGQWGNAATEEWGTDRMPAGEIIAKLLEQKPIRVTDTIEDEFGKKKSIPNLEATTAAQAKAEALQEKFSEWLWEDSARTKRLLANYNNQFNAIRLRSYDDVDRVFPGMAESFEPRAHQVAAVNRMVAEPCALLAHVVGAGKTAEMAMGCAELKRLGLARKPAIVVPNHMLEQFSREFLQIYPQAKILAAGTDDLDGDKRREFVARAATGDWDAVILTQKAMELIPMSRDNARAYIDRELATMRAQLTQAEKDAGDDEAKKKTVKRMENAIIKAEEALKAKLDKQQDAGVTFEQTGIDYLCVDEAHMYSNLRTLSNIQGAGAVGSNRATDLHMKLDHLRANNASGRVATFATGTPIRNTVTQAYIMQRYMRPDLLEQAGIHSFDQWAATFGQTVDEIELKPEGEGFRQTTRFSKFRNVPELLRLFQIFADVKMAEDLNLPTPTLKTGAVQNVVVPASDELRAYIKQLGVRAEQVRAGNVDPTEDNMLKVSGDGRKAALSMQLVGGQHQPGKIEAAADNIYKIWDANKDRPVPCDINDPAGGDCPPPGGMQIVFCDIGTPSDKWNAYDELRNQLAERGMDPNSIRFMHDADNDRKKAELFAACRNGQVSVIIGSTEKMGVGTNIQRRAVALHHLDAPWRPSDVEQRDGRIMRQGNTNAEVEIYRYVTEGSFDAYMWQTLERKAKFINQIMRGSLDQRDIEEVGDTALSYAEVKAIATGNPLLMAKARADSAVGKLSRLHRTHQRTQTNLRRDIDAYGAIAAQADADAAALDAAIKARTDGFDDPEKFVATIGGRRYADRTEAARALRDTMEAAIDNGRYDYRRDGSHSPVPLGTYGGHQLMGHIFRYEDERGYARFGMELSWDGLPGNIAKLRSGQIDNLSAVVFNTLNNSLTGFESRRATRLQSAQDHRDEIDKMRARVGVPFAHADELRQAQEESARLAEQMAAAGHSEDTGPQLTAAQEALATARANAGRQVANMGRGSWNKDAKNVLARFANPGASKAWSAPGGHVVAMQEQSGLNVFDPRTAERILPADWTKGRKVDDPEALLADLEAVDLPWDQGWRAVQQRWSASYPHDSNIPYSEREKVYRQRQEEAGKVRAADEAKLRAVWDAHVLPEEDKPPASGVDLAKERVQEMYAGLPPASRTSDRGKMLARFLKGSKRIPAYASDDGSVAAVTETSGRVAFFGTGTGITLNAPGADGPFDDPQAVANDLAALGIPWDDRDALNNRWYADRSQQKKDLEAVTAVYERHILGPEEKTLLPAELLERAAQLKDADQLPDEESYEDTVAADQQYVMSADGQLLKAVVCPSCGNTTYYPEAEMGNGSRTCLACGGKLQMQPIPATVG